jgi:hypothetical protein
MHSDEPTSLFDYIYGLPPCRHQVYSTRQTIATRQPSFSYSATTAMYKTLLAPTLFSALVAGHGHITNIVINGVSFGGWDINSYPYTDLPPTVVAWGTPNTANGFISPGMLLHHLTFPVLRGTSQYDHSLTSRPRSIYDLRYNLSCECNQRQGTRCGSCR